MAESRKIAAILAADVVGFSRMTSADEDGTLARLRALRGDLIDPMVALHNGRVFKRTGDGALIEFRSVVDAVRCAIAVQNSMAERFSAVPPERRIVFRIGIHLGDVVEQGDGVNIAVDYARTASTTLASDMVGTTRASRKPALASPHFSNYLCAPLSTIALCFLIFSARVPARVFIQPGAGCLVGI